MQRLLGKVALVTGGSSGIGRAFVTLCIIHGAKVVSIDLAGPVDPEQPYEEGVISVPGSVEDAAVWVAAMEASHSSFGESPNILVQCAGIPGRASLLDTTIESWNRVFAVNCTAVMVGMQTVIRSLVQSGRPGSIVNVSSLAGVVSMGGGFAYEASKAACGHMSKTAAMEYADKGIRVNCVAPGLTITGMTRNSTRTEASKHYMMDRTPLRRWATAEECAYSILYFASDEAAYVTGQVFCHDGGYSTA